MLSGGVEPPTLTDAPGVRVSIPADPSREGRGELNSPAGTGAVQTLNGEASGLVPEVLHECSEIGGGRPCLATLAVVGDAHYEVRL